MGWGEIEERGRLDLNPIQKRRRKRLSASDMGMGGFQTGSSFGVRLWWRCLMRLESESEEIKIAVAAGALAVGAAGASAEADPASASTETASGAAGALGPARTAPWSE